MRGSVIKRGGRWSVVIDAGRDDEGRRIRKWHSGYRTRKDAERARIELLGRVDQGTYVVPSRTTLKGFLVDEWLPAKRATVKQTTHASYSMHVDKHIVPRIGQVPLTQLTPGQLNALYAELQSSGRRAGSGALSPTTVRRIHATIHKALADAVRWGRLARNPADQSDPPKAAQPEMAVWTRAQLRSFLTSARDDRLYAAWLLMATTGMRRGEVLGLRWSDVDFDAGALSIRQIRTVANYVVITTTPKTDRGTRTIAVDPVTSAGLRGYRALQSKERLAAGPAYAAQRDGLVFTNKDGSPIHPERLTASFRQAARSAGMPPIRLHDVRHSYVTALLAEGVPLKVVSQRVGHSSPVVTMTIYQHVTAGDDRSAADTGARVILGDTL